MANDNRPEIVLDGDISPFRQKMREAASQLKQFGSEGEQAVGRISGPLGALQSKFLAIGALLAGGAVFKEAVAATATWTQESVDLAAALDMSAGAAAELKNALSAENVNVDEFVTAGQKLSAVLRSNEESLTQVGLVTRDAAGNLRPLNEMTIDAIELLGKYKAGTDRAVAADIMFGRGFKLNGDLAKINSGLVAEYAEKQRRLGVVMSEENVQAFEEYEQAGKDSAQTMRTLQHTIGNALMPVLTKLGEWFSAVGPAAVVVIRGAIGGLVAGFWALKNGVSVVWEVINAMVVSVAEPLRALASALVKIGTGDFSGALKEFRNAGQTMAGAWKGALAEMETSSAETKQKIANLFSEGTPTGKPGTGGKSATGLLKGDKDKKGEQSHMAEYEAQLAAKKNLYEQENLLRQYGKEQELAYWRELQQAHNLTSNDRLAIAKRTATLELEIRRQNAKEQRDLDAAMVDSRRAAALAQIQLEEQQANSARENGAITQRELIAQQEEFARRRFEIEYQSLMQRLELAKTDPNTSPAALLQIKEQMLEIERQYILRRGELQQQAVVESTAIWRSFTDTITGLWDKGIAALMNGTFTWSNAFRAAGAQMVSWFATEVVGKQVKDWIAGQAKMLAVKMGFMAAEKTAEVAAAATTVGTKAAETTAVVAANAAQAGSGAAAAVAPTPFVGPMLALAAMATVFGAVMALGGRQKSAAKGYDIPKGLNPMTQLHEEEMVLPSKFANVIRGMAAGGEGGQGGGGTTTNHYHISAIDSKSFERFAHENKRIFAGAVKSAGRDGFK